MAKYRISIGRHSKKKIPPGRKGKHVNTPSSSNIEEENQATTTMTDNDSTTTATDEIIFNSTCAKKLKLDNPKEKPSTTSKEQLDWCYLLFDTRVLGDIIDTIGSCPICAAKVYYFHNKDAKKGLAHFINISCTECDWDSTYSSSKEVQNEISKQGNNAFDINTRSVIAMREVGKGFTALKTFCGFMNIPSPMTQKTFSNIQESIGSSYVKSAEANMKAAADDVRIADHDGSEELADDEVVNTAISADGTWQRRGFSSRNGVVTIIANTTGKCVDYCVKTKICKACTYWKGKTGPKANAFRKKHKCPINHKASSGAMEADGVLECFLSSVEKNKLRYLTYIGDGDTKSYQTVVNANPYPGYVITKAECVGHVQKRVGTRLRKFKTDCKELMPESFYADKKVKTRKKYAFYLSHKMINKLQNCYGIAIRSCTNTSVPVMRKAVGAVLFHYSEAADSASRHQFCPATSTSWCKYQLKQLNGMTDYVEKPGLPIPLRKRLESIFRELSSPELLQKCLHGQTQNNNESLNGVIWKRCPKDIYIGRSVLEMSVSSAVISFNSGKRGILDVYGRCCLEPGPYTEQYCYLDDAAKAIRENVRSCPAKKKRRKTLRSIAKGYVDEEAKEDPSYSSGAFST